MFSTFAALIAANWILAGALLAVTFILLGLGLDWAVKLHYGEIRPLRPQLNLGLSRAEPVNGPP